MARRDPRRRLNSVDFPTLGLPTMAIVGGVPGTAVSLELEWGRGKFFVFLDVLSTRYRILVIIEPSWLRPLSTQRLAPAVELSGSSHFTSSSLPAACSPGPTLHTSFAAANCRWHRRSRRRWHNGGTSSLKQAPELAKRWPI